MNDDHPDRCPTGETGWESNGDTDHDGDGCQDSSEDTDDDNDGVNDDHPDKCPKGATGWTSNAGNDNDGDGCRDRDEDEDGGQGSDSDNDEVNDRFDLCPTSQTSNFVSTSANDIDGDGCEDGVEDIDDDGDGLIEIGTPEELNAIRYALDGSGYRSEAGGNLDQNGCGGTGGITQCNGYELVDNISLADYADNDNGKGWRPLGHDTSSGTDGCQGAAFDGTFEGNGFVISNLSIDRPTEDCVGLFGHIAANSEIRNLTLHAEAVTGKIRVGGLVGSVESNTESSVRIVSSSVVINEVSGSRAVGGLVGIGGSLGSGGGNVRIRIHSSSVVVGEVSGTALTFTNIGGLVGIGEFVWIHSSSVVAGKIRGSSIVGGLIGVGSAARIFSSSVVVDEMNGTVSVGGLMGSGNSAQIFSSSVVVGEVSGIDSSDDGGGLVGSFISGKVAYSYVVSFSKFAKLVGRGTSRTEVTSYWYNATNPSIDDQHRISEQLQMPTGYTDIYATWNDDTDIFNDGMSDEPLAVWCDKDNSGSIETEEQIPGNLIWDFGTNMEYPAIECTPLDPDDWRSWWSLDGDGKPQLDRARLDALFP